MTARAAVLLEAITDTVPRFVALAKDAPPDLRVNATPDWTVTDVVGHVAMEPKRYLGLHQVLPGWVDPRQAAGHSATYHLRLRGAEAYVYEFTDGRLVVDPPEPRRVDVHISAEPVTALLASYGRIGQLGPAVTGKVVTWGRRPWLALSLRRRFLSA